MEERVCAQTHDNGAQWSDVRQRMNADGGGACRP
jgi:hypothetical protein